MRQTRTKHILDLKQITGSRTAIIVAGRQLSSPFWLQPSPSTSPFRTSTPPLP
ncbi:hypothetical protein HanPSC8_Chr14g0616101 [Helianthus annuus]|nr:hypothetical protein HanPSC8_Chr14g0616101 [Helianthus annuus]